LARHGPPRLSPSRSARHGCRGLSRVTRSGPARQCTAAQSWRLPDGNAWNAGQGRRGRSGSARRGLARYGPARQVPAGEARRGGAGRRVTGRGLDVTAGIAGRPGKAWPGGAWHREVMRGGAVLASRGGAGPGWARQCKARFGRIGLAVLGCSWIGVARKAWPDRLGSEGLGLAGRGAAGPVVVRLSWLSGHIRRGGLVLAGHGLAVMARPGPGGWTGLGVAVKAGRCLGGGSWRRGALLGAAVVVLRGQRGVARRGWARPSWQFRASPGTARRGGAGRAWRGLDWLGAVRPGRPPRRRWARRGSDGGTRHGVAAGTRHGQDEASRGLAWRRGPSWPGLDGEAARGMARQAGARPGKT